MDKVIEINLKDHVQGLTYRLEALKDANLNIPVSWHSAHPGFAGIGRQLHPFRAKYID